jgi:electron transfer flavoprotein alpha subunit
MSSLLVFAEQRDGKIKKAAFEAVSKGHDVAAKLGLSLLVVAIGDGLDTESLGNYGASKVIVFDNPQLANYSANAYAKLIAKAAKENDATVIFMSATAMGKDLAPRVAIRTGAALASDCTDLKLDGTTLLAVRPVYSGKAFATVELNSPVKLYTLRPNVFAVTDKTDAKAAVEKISYQPDEADLKTIVKEIVVSAGKLDVTEADIVVSGGRGLKAPENFHLVEKLAAVLGGAVGASRAVVDAGWRPHSEQVGQTGKVVSPKLYIACGISGAVQHLAGMSSSKIIVAINKDKDAPIFQVADYGIVGDALELLPQLTDEFEKILKH